MSLIYFLFRFEALRCPYDYSLNLSYHTGIDTTKVDVTERCLVLFVVFILYIYQHVQSELTGKNQDKQLEKITNVYSSSKANDFLTYDKCMQRMKCPVNRKEECSEECKAGNTEEEIEEHQELTMDEDRNIISNRPKPRFDTDKRSNKKESQSTIKTDL